MSKSNSNNWKGQDEFCAILNDLTELAVEKGYSVVASTSEMNKAVEAVFRYKNEYKFVAYEIERWIKRLPLETKVIGLQLIDHVIMSSKKDKDLYAARFSMRMTEIFKGISEITETDTATAKKIVDGWQKHELVPSDVLQASLKCLRYSNNNILSTNTLTSVIDISLPPPPQSVATSTQSGVKRVMQSSITEASKPTQAIDSSLGKRKLCPYAGKLCPFGNKCKLIHDIQVLFPTQTKKCRPTESMNHLTLLNKYNVLLRDISNEKSDLFSIQGKAPRNVETTNSTKVSKIEKFYHETITEILK